jgi:hypothetical protein
MEGIIRKLKLVELIFRMYDDRASYDYTLHAMQVVLPEYYETELIPVNENINKGSGLQNDDNHGLLS